MRYLTRISLDGVWDYRIIAFRGSPPFSIGNTDVRTLHGTSPARAVLRALRGQSARQYLDRDRAPVVGFDPRRKGPDEPDLRPLPPLPRKHPQGNRGPHRVPREGVHLGRDSFQRGNEARAPVR